LTGSAFRLLYKEAPLLLQTIDQAGTLVEVSDYWLKTLGIQGAYELKDLSPEAFPGFVTGFPANGYIGGNVTVPNKEAAYRIVHSRDEAAKAIGAVNTLWLERSSVGGIRTRTDSSPASTIERRVGACRAAVWYWAREAPRAPGYPPRQTWCAVSGQPRSRRPGSCSALRSRVPGEQIDELPGLLAAADMLVVHLAWHGGQARARNRSAAQVSAVVYDIVYVPLETPLLAAARLRGHRTVDGLGMLLQQAGFGFRKWFGGAPRVTLELRAIVEADIVARTPKN
jgi:shikimate dehydrogenase